MTITGPIRLQRTLQTRSSKVVLALTLGALIRPSVGSLARVDFKHDDPLRACVDGTPVSYFWKPAAKPIGKNTWLVDLQMGDWCHDEASCRKRCKPNTTEWLCSSKTWPASYAVGGIFWPAGNDRLKYANKVFVAYCTSDGHMGDAEAWGMQFRGDRVIKSVFRDLVSVHGLGGGSERDVLIFGGQSAGSRGAMIHLDYVSSMMGDAAKNVDVHGFLDSPYWLDIWPFPAKGNVKFDLQAQHVYRAFNVKHLGEHCIRTFPELDRWKCLFGQYRMPWVLTPYFLVAAQYDSFQLASDFSHPGRPKDPGQAAYADGFARQTVSNVRNLRRAWRDGWSELGSHGSKQNAVYSWACWNHAQSLTAPSFIHAHAGPNRTSMNNAFLQFMGWAPIDAPSTPLEWIDECDGFNCGTGCPTQELHI